MVLSPGVLPGGCVRGGARVYNSAAINLATGGYTRLTFDTERYDTLNLHSTTVNPGRLTAPVAGRYLIGGHVVVSDSALGRFRILAVELNGTTYLAQQSGPGLASMGPYLSVATPYKLAVGDYVSLAMYQDSGGVLTASAGAAYSPEFWIELLEED